jgi:hypothetical protein
LGGRVKDAGNQRAGGDADEKKELQDGFNPPS